uniref:DUF6824 domain-containing protein n=2 Tax=Pseudo-nitzschia australis TaxID=44445 RepID=A0A7S4A8N7_9STRA
MDHDPRPPQLPLPCDTDECDIKAAAELLEREMSQLSLQEQYQMNQDVNGMNFLARTEPTALSSIGLEALDKQLRTIHDNLEHYRLAEKLNSAFIKERFFRLRFARAECFDSVKAAIRIEKYLRILYEYFGEEALRRPIKLTDLDKVERDLLKSGCIQIFPYRDLSGRRIISTLGNFGTRYHTLKNKIKVIAYVMQVLSEDEETQKQGCVFLFWPLVPTCTISKQVNCAVQISPIRISAIHFMLYDTIQFRKLGALQLLAMSRESRARTRLHFGSIHQCQQELLPYGISSHFLPVTNTGNIKNQNLLKWFAFRQAKERALEGEVEFNGVDCPSVKDILTGKGPHVSSNPANVTYRKMMETRFLEHRDALSAEKKTAISREIVDEVVKNGGRFLIKDRVWWAIGDRDTAREKVSVAFRDMRKIFLQPEKRRNDGESSEKKRKKSSDRG